MTDVEAAHASGSAAIGYANAAGKVERLTIANTDAIVTTMAAIAEILLSAAASP